MQRINAPMIAIGLLLVGLLLSTFAVLSAP